jgi:GTPase
MAFVDEAVVSVKAGRGGDGAATFHSEPYKPMGGPDGGDGGRGGSVILEVTPGIHDLSDLAARPHRKAASGTGGSNAKRNGARGKDLVIPVPDGTVVRDERGFVADLLGAGTRVVVAAGGRGGRGNVALASSRNKAPTHADAGEEGEEHELQLELRTIADVGLVGLPNAGKSTLLAALTRARPKIANYPFTTLDPNIGVSEGERRVVLADVPGLIEGASEGRGLGHRFLRHVSRCPVIACVVDLSAPDPAADVATVRAELAAYDPGLPERAMVVVGTHADLLEAEDVEAALAGLSAENVVVASGVTGEGIEALAERFETLAAPAGERAARSQRRAVVLRPGREEFTVRREGERFRVIGRQVERWIAETDMEDEAEVQALQGRFVREGVERALAKAGARRGDEVVIGSIAFEFIPEEGEKRG